MRRTLEALMAILLAIFILGCARSGPIDMQAIEKAEISVPEKCLPRVLSKSEEYARQNKMEFQVNPIAPVERGEMRINLSTDNIIISSNSAGDRTKFLVVYYNRNTGTADASEEMRDQFRAFLKAIQSTGCATVSPRGE